MRALSPDTWIEAYTHVGAGNRRIIEKVARVLARFREHGIDFLLLKGADITVSFKELATLDKQTCEAERKSDRGQ